jgi:protein-tyrosine phosphatase
MGLFSKFFGERRPDLGPVDLSVLKCDVHSHFIPGIDDGSQSVEQSVELINAMHELGFSKVITTPHVMADGYRNSPDVILSGLDTVRRALQAKNIPVQIDAAAEYYLDHELEQKVMARNVLTFGDNYLLFELPFISEPQILFSVVFTMQTQGYRPVLAHPERYTYWYQDVSSMEKLKDRNVLFQLNTVALAGAYGPQARKAAEKLVDLGWYDLVGSDCHNLGHVEMLKNARNEHYLHKLIGSGKLLNPQL